VTEDEALAQLRDIHLPTEIETAGSIQLAAWPFIALAIIVGTILAIRFLNQHRWRRRAQSDLARIAQTEDRAEQWSMLLAFAQSLPARTGRKVPLPSLAYRRPETITDSERAAFIDSMSGELRR
jgi:hypothetical protein